MTHETDLILSLFDSADAVARPCYEKETEHGCRHL